MTEREMPRMKGHAVMAYGLESGSFFDVPMYSQIEENLWVGCSPSEFPSWEYKPLLRQEDGQTPMFDKILNLYPWGFYGVPDRTEKIDVEMYDSEDIDGRVTELAEMVNQWLDEGKRVLVHCQAGLNRSSFVTARALMLRGKTADEAIDLIRSKRSPLCLCNDHFRQHLKGLT